MANNRLFLVDISTGEHIMLAKSFGTGWDWRRTPEELTAWLEERDVASSYGNCWPDAVCTLQLMTENDSAYQALPIPVEEG